LGRNPFSPREDKLREVASKLLTARDEVTCQLLAEIIAFVQENAYGSAAGHFLKLTQDLRAQIGFPPMSRAEDLRRGNRQS
jgi:hypothetical protein